MMNAGSRRTKERCHEGRLPIAAAPAVRLVPRPRPVGAATGSGRRAVTEPAAPLRHEPAHDEVLRLARQAGLGEYQSVTSNDEPQPFVVFAAVYLSATAALFLGGGIALVAASANRQLSFIISTLVLSVVLTAITSWGAVRWIRRPRRGTIADRWHRLPRRIRRSVAVGRAAPG